MNFCPRVHQQGTYWTFATTKVACSQKRPISFCERFQVQVGTVWFQLAGGLISCCANLQAVKLLFNIWPNMNILNLYLFIFFNQSYCLTFSSSKLNKIKTSERGLNFKNSYII